MSRSHECVAVGTRVSLLAVALLVACGTGRGANEASPLADIVDPEVGVRDRADVDVGVDPVEIGAGDTPDAVPSFDTVDIDDSDTAGELGTDVDVARDMDLTDAEPDAEHACPPFRPSGRGPDDLPAIRYPPTLVDTWSVSTGMGTSSSPLFRDVNRDGVLDVVLGFGEEEIGPEEPALGSLRVLDGVTGETLWHREFDREFFTLPVAVQHPETCEAILVAGGRAGELAAVRDDGSLLWHFNDGIDPRDDGLFNFYTPQTVGDLDDDGFPDLLITNGGDTTIERGDPRPPGHVMVMSTATGEVLARAPTPDLAETYASPALVDLPDGETGVYFGTGGETNQGSFWRVRLSEILSGDLSGNEPLVVTTAPKGVIAPASLADINADGVVDVVGVTFGGVGFAIDGATDALIWELPSEVVRESYSTAALGQLDGDGIPDAVFSFSLGEFPEYDGVEHFAVSGATGDVLWSERAEGALANSALLVDLDDDGLDEILVQRSGFARDGFVNQLIVVNPRTWEVFESLPRPGAGVGTGAVVDLDGDGRLEWIASSRRFLRGRESWTWRSDLSAVSRPIAWGGYLGTRGDRRY